MSSPGTTFRNLSSGWFARFSGSSVSDFWGLGSGRVHVCVFTIQIRIFMVQVQILEFGFWIFAGTLDLHSDFRVPTWIFEI